MSHDISRLTFNPRNDFFGPVMQQGRVHLDSDWNEWLAQVGRRIQAGTYDTFGAAPGPSAVYPATTPNAFKLEVLTDPTGTRFLSIGPGRMYVDGLLAENHGQAPPITQPPPVTPQWVPPSATSVSGLAWDSALDELFGDSGVSYDQQPYYPGAPPFPTGVGPYLVYLDVWKREVTFIEHPDLVEKAVGIDTTGRMQTVWQVKFLPRQSNSPLDCSSDIPEWNSLLLAPGANLTTGVTQVGSPGPCCLTPNTGYTGLENQLYRLEIHQPQPPPKPAADNPFGTGTFKWSRDNASVVTAVNAITQSGLVLGVESVGKDNVLCFSPNDWVEITDDWLELNGLPGELRRIAPNGVDASAKTLTLATALPLTTAVAPVVPVKFLVDANGITDPQRHTRVRRWDQAGKIYASDGVNVWADLNDPKSTGDIRVPPPGTSLVLENGITVTFGWNWDATKPTAPLKSGDFWNFAARATDGTVEYLDHAPPRGIHHHYCRLGVGSIPNAPFSDCRTKWPPATTESCCECTICVTAEEHNSGNHTIQAAIDIVKGLPFGGKVCLGPGNYTVRGTINIIGMKSLTIAGHGETRLYWAPRDKSTTAILIDSSVGVTLENFGLVVPTERRRPTTVPNPGVMIQNSAFVTVKECSFVWVTNQGETNSAIALGGYTLQTSIKNNFISFSTSTGQIGPGVGLSHLTTMVPDLPPQPILLTLDLFVEDNFIQTSSSGVDFNTLCVHAWQVRIQNNFIGPSDGAGITVAGLGVPTPEASVEITYNEIVTSPIGHGIICGVGAARISDNDILCLASDVGLPPDSFGGDGILLEAPFLAETALPLDGLQLVGNRISGVAGIGIEIRSQIASAVIHQNLIENTGAGGIIMTASLAGVFSAAQHLSIANNQLLKLIPDTSNPMVTLLNGALGIRLLFTAVAEIEGNVVRDLALNPNGTPSRVGIGLLACGSVRISRNQVINIGNPESPSFESSAGIAVLGPLGRLEVSGNTSQRSETLTPSTTSNWYALFVGELTDFITKTILKVVPTNPQSTQPIQSYYTNLYLKTVLVGLRAVSLRGNFLAASTASELAKVILTGSSPNDSCIFTENQCVLIPSDVRRSPIINVSLSARAVIAGNNFINGGTTALDIHAEPGSNINDPARATIVGNVLNGGEILVNNASPNPKAAALNV